MRWQGTLYARLFLIGYDIIQGDFIVPLPTEISIDVRQTEEGKVD